MVGVVFVTVVVGATFVLFDLGMIPRPIRTRHLFTVSMPSLHWPSSLQTAADTLVNPLSLPFDSTFRYASVYTTVAVMTACRQCCQNPLYILIYMGTGAL